LIERSFFNGLIKLLLGLLIGVSVAALTAFNILLAWVATGPRSLDALTPYIEASLEPADHKYSVSIGETWLLWDGWKHPIDIRLRKVKVLTSERRTYSKFPEVSLGLDLLGLVRGHIYPTSFTLTHPVLSLFQNEDRSISFGTSGLEAEAVPADALKAEAVAAPAEEIPAIPLSAVLAPFLTPDEHSSLRKLRLVSIVNADLLISNKRKGVFFKTTGADITFKHNHEGLQAYGNAKISYDNYQSLIAVHFTKKKDSSSVSGEIGVNQLMPGTLMDLFADNNFLGGMDFPISGSGSLVADMNGTLQHASFSVDGGKGTLTAERLDGPVPITSLHVDGQLDNDADKVPTLKINKLNADIDGMLIDADGTASGSRDNPVITANIVGTNIPVEKGHVLWPLGVAPLSREWVTTNISTGRVTKVQAHVDIKSGDIAKPELPKEDVDASVELEGAKVRYLPEHPEVIDLKGTIHIDGKSLDAQIASAHYMKDTKLSEGRVLIEDLNPDNPYIKITLSAESSARDAVHFLSLPPLKHAQRLNLSQELAEGTLKGHAALGFYFFAKRDQMSSKEGGKPAGDPDISFDVTAELKNLAQPGFMKKFDVKNADGTLSVNNQLLEFKGSGSVNDASVSESVVKYLFKPEKGFDTFIDATATAPVEVLPRFGYPQFPFLKGMLGVKAKVKEGKDIEANEAVIDLTHAAITMPDLGVMKPDNEPASLEITADKKDDAATIPNFEFKGKSIDAHGSAELSKDMSGLRRVSMDKYYNGNTHLDQFAYEKTNDGMVLEMVGKSADVSPWLGNDDKAKEGAFSFEHFPNLQLKTDLVQVFFGEGRELENVKGTLNCVANYCESANIAGTTSDNKPFNFRILRNPKGRRQLSLHVQNAGSFLKSVNLFDGMEGGDMTITGNYSEAGADNPNSVFKGRLDINEHTIKDASVLAKIVSLASFTGIFDTLQGKGIHFVRLSAPFTISKDVVTLEKAKTHGDALGMTADGTITFPKGTLDIQGTIVPSYTLNHVLGNVPLLGSVLTGGEGQGVFAARYSVKGTQKNPDVSVNPLSILTPGFLRGLFDLFDAPKKDEDEEG